MRALALHFVNRMLRQEEQEQQSNALMKNAQERALVKDDKSNRQRGGSESGGASGPVGSNGGEAARERRRKAVQEETEKQRKEEEATEHRAHERYEAFFSCVKQYGWDVQRCRLGVASGVRVSTSTTTAHGKAKGMNSNVGEGGLAANGNVGGGGTGGGSDELGVRLLENYYGSTDSAHLLQKGDVAFDKHLDILRTNCTDIVFSFGLWPLGKNDVRWDVPQYRRALAGLLDYLHTTIPGESEGEGTKRGPGGAVEEATAVGASAEHGASRENMVVPSPLGKRFWWVTLPSPSLNYNYHGAPCDPTLHEGWRGAGKGQHPAWLDGWCEKGRHRKLNQMTQTMVGAYNNVAYEELRRMRGLDSRFQFPPIDAFQLTLPLNELTEDGLHYTGVVEEALLNLTAHALCSR
jgi:hypothetical protein